MEKGYIRNLLRRYGVTLQKGGGQNFLVSRDALERIASLVKGEGGGRVIEVGAGVGNLTLALLQRGAAVTAIERDPLLFAILREELKGYIGKGLHLVKGDVLKIDLPSLSGGGRAILCGNIPYSISTPLTLRAVRERASFSAMVFLVQKEFGERLASSQGSRGWGALPVLVRTFMKVEPLFTLEPELFFPAPKVHSLLVRLSPMRPEDGTDTDDLFAFLQRVFAMRRKKIENVLKGLGIGPRERGDILNHLDLKGDERPDALSPETLYRLFESMVR